MARLFVCLLGCHCDDSFCQGGSQQPSVCGPTLPVLLLGVPLHMLTRARWERQGWAAKGGCGYLNGGQTCFCCGRKGISLPFMNL